MNIAFQAILPKLPIEQIENTVRQHIAPLISYLPDKRLGRVAELSYCDLLCRL